MAFDLIVFNRQVYLVLTETLAQQVNLFNAASAGAITLVPTSENVGDFAMRASFKQIANLVRRRDVYNGSNTVTEARLQQLQNNSVKVPSGTPPIIYEAAQYNWVKQNPESAALVIGEQLAVGMMGDMLNVAISGAVAAISAVTDLNHMASTAITFNDLVQGAGKFGDRMGALAAWVLHSKSMTDLYGNAVTNGERLFSYEAVNVIQDPFGRRFIMTDSDSLVDNAGQPKYKLLGLVPGAVMVEQNNDFDANTTRDNGTENIQTSYQAEWSYQLGVLGYSWNVANGGKAPSNAAIATPASWDKTATSIKDTAGVLITAS
ncbi:hypothetical protein C4J81_13770 [Deltaproteobacteria bacterium Smac51]|nr:hypothetical protein C4J81_13770 [Deltaproteobacteria bacterium Smac51]